MTLDRTTTARASLKFNPLVSNVLDEKDVAGQLVLRLGYKGTDFAGYAEQREGIRTVAGELRQALKVLLHRDVDMVCAGRTDAGVHAIGQYVSVPLLADELLRSGSNLHRGLTALCPDDISIEGIYKAGPDFSARFDAVRRHYVYRVVAGQARPSLCLDLVWWLRTASPLDLTAMQEASQLLIGEHDFASFCKQKSLELIREAGNSSVREIDYFDIAVNKQFGIEMVEFRLGGTAFLHNMVRIMVGTLVDVGKGTRSLESIAEVLAACDRAAAGQTAPAHGLCFAGVDYTKGTLEAWL